MNIEWNQVTWYSKIAAVVLFVCTFFLGFWLGTMKAEKIFVDVPHVVYHDGQTGVGASSQELLPAPDDLFTLPIQEKVFTDPEGKYRVSIPDGMVYRYTPLNQFEKHGELSLWTKQGWALREKIIKEDRYIEGGSSFSIRFTSQEDWEEPQLTQEEIARIVSVGDRRVTVYAPFATFAGHEQAMMPAKEGVLMVWHPFFGNDSQLWFDRILQSIELL